MWPKINLWELILKRKNKYAMCVMSLTFSCQSVDFLILVNRYLSSIYYITGTFLVCGYSVECESPRRLKSILNLTASFALTITSILFRFQDSPKLNIKNFYLCQTADLHKGNGQSVLIFQVSHAVIGSSSSTPPLF